MENFLKMLVNSSVMTSVTSLVKTFTKARASVKISVNNFLVTSVETLVLMDLPVPSSLGPHSYF